MLLIVPVSRLSRASYLLNSPRCSSQSSSCLLLRIPTVAALIMHCKVVSGQLAHSLGNELHCLEALVYGIL